MDWRELLRFGHPSFLKLSMYADGDLEDGAAARTARHLEKCVSCRRELKFIRKTEEMAKDLPTPRPPPGLLEEILESRAKGERTILPTADPPPSPPSRPRNHVVVGSVVGALLAVAAAVALLSLGSSGASAGANVLHVAPEAPRAGARVEIAYRTASHLAGEARLRLEGRFRTAEEPPPRTEDLGHPLEAWLEADEPGRFVGEVELPPSAVYAAFAVADSAASRVDARGGRLWEVLVRDETGAPVPAALRQRYRVMERLDPLRALETARRMTELYPNRAEGWQLRLVYEQLLVPEGARDSLGRAYERRFRELERVAAAREANDAEELAGLVFLARGLDSWPELDLAEEAARWGSRLRARFPTHPGSVNLRVLELLGRHAGDPGALLSALEEEWRRSGPAGDLLVEMGLRTAVRVGDAEAALRWGRRYTEVQPGLAGSVVEDLAAFPAVGEETAGIVREALWRLEGPGPASRFLVRSAPEERRVRMRERRKLLVTLGRILADQGRLASALDTLEIAAATGWDPEAFATLADLRLRAGDAPGALEAYGRVAADPLAPADSVAGAVRTSLGSAFDPEAWDAAVRAGARALEARVRAREESGSVPAEVTLTDSRGRSLELADLMAGRTTLLVSWTRLSAGSSTLEALARWLPLLQSAGVRLVAVTREAPSPALERYLAESGPEIPVYHDASGEAVEALGLWLTPDFLVVDDRGGIRFRPGGAEEAVRRAVLLAAERREGT